MELDSRARRPPRHRLRLDLGRELPRPLRRDGQPQRRDARRQLAAAHRGARLGRRPRRRSGTRPDARRPARRDGRRRLRAQSRARLPARVATPRPRSSPRSPTRPVAHGGFYHSHVRYPLGDRYLDPFREAIEIGRRAGAPAHITHFYHRETHPGGARADARARRRRARRRPRRHLRHLSVRVGLDAPAHPAPAVDPGRRTGTAQGRASPTGRRATASAPSSRPVAPPTPARPAGPTSGSGPSVARRTCAGRAGPSRTS